MLAIKTIIDKTTEYLTIPSIVGHEGGFMHFLKMEFEKLGLRTEIYEGILAVHGNAPYSNIACAHIDRHGLISLGNNEFAYAAQYIKEIKYGEPNRSSRAELHDIMSRFEGEHVFAYNSDTHEVVGEGCIESCTPSAETGNSVFCVNGLDDIEIGTPVSYAREATLEDGKFKGQIDNVLSVATLYALFQNGYQGSALLSCEEEIGKSWTHIAAYLKLFEIETQSLLVLDTSPYSDPEPIDAGRVIFRNRDKSEYFNPALTAQLIERAASLGQLYQIKDEYLLSVGKREDQLGSTELGRLIQNETHGNGARRWNGATIQIPTMMYHTSYETTSLKAIDNFYAFLENILIINPIVEEVGT
ncbi:MAG: peptidase M42 [Alphaproteobacteria bacterium]